MFGPQLPPPSSLDKCSLFSWLFHTFVHGYTALWHTRSIKCHGALPPPRSSRAAAAVVIIGLNREDVSGQSTDQTMQRCVMLLCDCHRLAIFQAASSDHPCNNYCPVNSMSALSSAHMWGVLVHDSVQSLGAVIIARLLILRSISRYHLIDMNPRIIRKIARNATCSLDSAA